jgi:V8-like Glu-specific endopeptidase
MAKKAAQVNRNGGVEFYAEAVEDELTLENSVESAGAASDFFEADRLETDDADDHGTVSSTETLASMETDVEMPAFGEAGAPSAGSGESDLESVAGYDETMLEKTREDAFEQAGEKYMLDAWYAEFADPVTLALAYQQPRLAESAQEVVIGADDRVQVTNTTAYPWRTICSLRITAKDGSRWIGTGALVGPRTILTAGHVVYMHNHGGWVSNIEVIPGRNGAAQPFGSCRSTLFHSVKGWTESKKRSHDYGAIILPSDCKYGNQVGYFGFANLGFFSLLGLKVNLSGYPGDKPTGTQWWHARAITFVTARTLVYNIDTAGGQSGSPVWRLKDGKRHIVGIHTNGSPLGNSATRITEPVFNNIKSWKESYS